MAHSVRLKYAFRTGMLTGVAGRLTVNIAARLTPEHVQSWEKLQEFRPARWSPSDHVFSLPDESTGHVLRVSKAAGVLLGSQSPTACDSIGRAHSLFVDDGAGGCFIHGWPPCRCARCIVLPHGIEDLVRAVDADGTLIIVR